MLFKSFILERLKVWLNFKSFDLCLLIRFCAKFSDISCVSKRTPTIDIISRSNNVKKPSSSFSDNVPFSIGKGLFAFKWLNCIYVICDLCKNLYLWGILLLRNSTLLNGFNDLLSFSKIKGLG